MVISSRTPEGVPNHCPVCGNDLRIEPSRPTLDAPCPHCGHLLWFVESKPLAVRLQMIDYLFLVLEAKFGPLEPATRVAIESVTDPARLKKIADLAVSCSRVEEVVAGL